MASHLELVNHLCAQLGDAGTITYKKMFGEYGLYCDGKFFACVCDDQFFVKITQAGREFMPECHIAPAYEGGGPYFQIEEVDDKSLLAQLAKLTCAELPSPKPKKKKVP
ncbi:MAG: TfoX/Sxy family protein [Dehalococcoidia bacterium]|nr:TfoX/Sxy family protein [Dehalococcoidia bacterium]